VRERRKEGREGRKVEKGCGDAEEWLRASQKRRQRRRKVAVVPTQRRRAAHRDLM
jgi:hypothetical protein